MTSYRKEFLNPSLHFLSQYYMTWIKIMVTINDAKMSNQSCQEKGETNVHNEKVLLD